MKEQLEFLGFKDKPADVHLAPLQMGACPVTVKATEFSPAVCIMPNNQ